MFSCSSEREYEMPTHIYKSASTNILYNIIYYITHQHRASRSLQYMQAHKASLEDYVVDHLVKDEAIVQVCEPLSITS